MSKCGKGCMPECEYFTTGGCISPFNCIYKEESGYINSATSGTVIYTGGMNMFDEKIIENLKCVIADISEQCEQLKAENAALRERLEKAVELPFVPSDHHIEMWAAQIKESCVDQCATIVIPCYLYIKCEDKNAAVERLNELRQYADN